MATIASSRTKAGEPNPARRTAENASTLSQDRLPPLRAPHPRARRRRLLPPLPPHPPRHTRPRTSLQQPPPPLHLRPHDNTPANPHLQKTPHHRPLSLLHL